MAAAVDVCRHLAGIGRGTVLARPELIAHAAPTAAAPVAAALDVPWDLAWIGRFAVFSGPELLADAAAGVAAPVAAADDVCRHREHHHEALSPLLRRLVQFVRVPTVPPEKAPVAGLALVVPWAATVLLGLLSQLLPQGFHGLSGFHDLSGRFQAVYHRIVPVPFHVTEKIRAGDHALAGFDGVDVPFALRSDSLSDRRRRRTLRCSAVPWPAKIPRLYPRVLGFFPKILPKSLPISIAGGFAHGHVLDILSPDYFEISCRAPEVASRMMMAGDNGQDYNRDDQHCCNPPAFWMDLRTPARAAAPASAAPAPTRTAYIREDFADGRVPVGLAAAVHIDEVGICPQVLQIIRSQLHQLTNPPFVRAKDDRLDQYAGRPGPAYFFHAEFPSEVGVVLRRLPFSLVPFLPCIRPCHDGNDPLRVLRCLLHRILMQLVHLDIKPDSHASLLQASVEFVGQVCSLWIALGVRDHGIPVAWTVTRCTGRAC